MFNAKFVFTVSIVAMMAVGAVNAATVTTTATVGAGAISGTTGTAGDVYDWSKWPGYKTEGIAGVTYVNKAVDAAGNAAQWAENHAAAAGTSAKNAADSATSANTAAKNAADSAAAANESLKTAVKVTTAGTAVGSATKPVYVDANGKVQPITSYSGNAASATKATQDGNGKVIAETYATKEELNAVNATAGNAVVANPAITGGTGTKITYDSKGLVTGSTSLAESDIPTLSSSKISNLGTISAANMGTSATTVVAAIKEVVGEAAAAQATADKAVQTNQGTANVGKGLVVDGTTGNLTLTDVATQAELNALTTANSNVSADVATLKSDVSGLKTSVSELDSDKQDVISDLATIRSGATAGSTAVQTDQTTTNANKIMITNASGSVTPVAVTASGSGNVVTAVSVADGKLTVTKGTTLGSLATKSSVASADITDGEVATADLADGAVTTAKIADLNVTTGKLAADAVTNAKLADNAVQTENIAAGAVGTTDIADGAVATADLADGAVTTAKIADLNVTTAKIAANAVTVAKTSGIYGYIPTASDGSGAAQIWVE